MKLEDIISLAKAGYKPSDIKELVKLAEEPEEQKEPKEPKEHKEPTEPDERDKQIKELEEQIKKLQDYKSRRDNSGGKHDKESLVDIFRDFIE